MTTVFTKRLLLTLRAAAITILCLLLALLVLANSATALNIYQDSFVTLSARPLGLGGAFAALSGPESVFYNPAGLAAVRRLRLMHNHSARHFPGSREGGATEYDQLDGDTQCITVPLPFATYAHGLTLNGEMGYDYRNHPADGSLGYPRERYWGTEDYDSLAFSFGLPVSAGYSMRRHLGRFSPDSAAVGEPAWIRLGDGQQWGIIARLWPGLDYGLSELDMDYDWTIMQSGAGNTLPEFSSSVKLKREGWALRPAAWLLWVSDTVDERWIFENPKHPEEAAAFAGTLHSGNRRIERLMRGLELNIGNLLWLRQGNYDGHPTVGLSLNLGGALLNYAEADGLLPDLVGNSANFESIHIYGVDMLLN